MKLRQDAALQLVELRFGQRVAPYLSKVSEDSPLYEALVGALRDRLLLAERGLNRAGTVEVSAGEPPLSAVWLAIRSCLSRGEVAEWNKLDTIIHDLCGRIDSQPAPVRP